MLEIEGDYALSIVLRMQELIDSTLKDCMPTLSSTTCLSYPSPSTSFVQLERIKQSAESNSHLKLGVGLSIPPEKIYELYSPFIYNQEGNIYDYMLSYRWDKFSKELVAKIFDYMTKYAVGGSQRQIRGFLDDKSLKVGINFQSSFATALMNSTIVVPILSSMALERMIKHDPTREDNVLIEWILAIECFASDQSRVERVIPIAFKLDEKTEKVLDFYGLVQTLPETVPIESIRIAKNALLSHDPPITPRDSVDSLTVRAIVDQIYKNKGVMFHELEPSERVVHCSQTIYSALSECKGISDFEDAKTPFKLRDTDAQTTKSIHQPTPTAGISNISISSPGGETDNLNNKKFNEAWNILKNAEKTSRDPTALTAYLKGKGMLNAEDLSFAEPEQHATIAGFLLEIQAKKYKSYI